MGVPCHPASRASPGGRSGASRASSATGTPRQAGYRRLPDVLREHEGTIKVLHTLRPFAVAMAGPGEFDPYKD
jgi:hypothetical protein